jgi:hypothetical protein
MRKNTLFLATLICLAAPAQAQEGLEQPVVDSPVPATSEVIPPPVPDRPPLATPVNPAPSPSPDGPALIAPIVKPALAWRARAQDLKTNEQAQSRSFCAAYDDVLLALISSLPKFNLRVDVLNSDSGELLACTAEPDSQQRIIFAITEMPPGNVIVKASAFGSSKQLPTLIQNVMQSLTVNPPIRRGTY